MLAILGIVIAVLFMPHGDHTAPVNKPAAAISVEQPASSAQ